MSTNKKPRFCVGDPVIIKSAARKAHREYIRDSGAKAGEVFRIRYVFPPIELWGGKVVTEIGYCLEPSKDTEELMVSLIMNESEIRISEAWGASC